MNKDEALKMAIEVFQRFKDESINDKEYFAKMADANFACQKALEQTAQEPVAFIDVNWVINYTEHGVNSCYEPTVNPNGKLNIGTKLYTHPAPSWQGLSDDEVQTVFNFGHKTFKEFARAIEQALKEKNGR